MSDAERLEFIHKIAVNTRELDHLVGQLLDIAGLERGQRFPTTLEPPSLRSEVDDAIGAVELLVGDREVAIDGADDHVIADRQLLRRTLVNLISNAAKFSPAGARIEIGPFTLPLAVPTPTIDATWGAAAREG